MAIRRTRRAIWIAAALTSTLLSVPARPIPAWAASGDLDPAFGEGGMVIAGCSVWDDEYFGCLGGYAGRLYEVETRSDGRIVAVGARQRAHTTFAVVRQFANGASDTSFGRVGRVLTRFAHPSAAFAMAFAEDGSVVAAGSSAKGPGGSRDTDPGASFALARYSEDGDLDRTFTGNGRVRTSFGQARAAAYAVAVQHDGKVVAAGLAGRAFAMARYGIDGVLDPTFGSEGKVRAHFLDRTHVSSASAIQILRRGRILVAGVACDASACNLVLARFLPDGTADAAFGSAGSMLVPVRDHSRVDMAVASDGAIVVGAGRLLMRFRPDGVLDGSFSDDGIVETPASASGVGILADGGIVVTGPFRYEPWSFDTVRFDADGRRVRRFGDGGTASAPFPGFDSVGYGLTVQPDGAIVVVGTTSDINIDGRFALARFLAT
jgi:uncharacterized delta-60 repeat protein